MSDCWPNHTSCAHREYIGQACTHQGKPAKIVKTADGYAEIAPLDPEQGTIGYSWVAVFNIMENHGGKFN